MKHLFYAFLMTISIVSPTLPAWAGAPVKGFREWKSDRVHQAQGRIEVLKVRIDQKKTDPNTTKQALAATAEGRDPDVAKMEFQLRQEAMALENARELTVSDYFAGYLTKMSDRRTAFKEAATKLSAEEIAELMSAYATTAFGAISPQSMPLGPDASR